MAMTNEELSAYIDELLELVEAAETAASDELAAFGCVYNGEPTMVDELLDSLDPYEVYDATGSWDVYPLGWFEAVIGIYDDPDWVADEMIAFEYEYGTLGVA